MSEKSEALRLADALMTLFPSREDGERAAAELRRLSAENEAIKAERNEDRRREYGYSQQVVDALTNERDVLLAQRDALLEALKELMEYAGIIEERCDTVATNKARAVIKAVGEGK